MTTRPPLVTPGLALSRRRFVTGTAAAGLLAGGVALTGCATTATAAPAAVAARADAGPYRIVLNTDGLTAPATVACGVAHFRVSTPGQGGRALLLVRLRAGYAVDYVTTRLASTSASTPAQKAVVARELQAAAEYLGGGNVSGGVEVGFTRVLGPGTYHLINFNYASATERPSTAVLQVSDRAAAGGWPSVDDLVVHSDRDGTWGFQVPSETLKARGNHLVVNSTSSSHELMLGQVRPGTTEDAVRAYYASMARGVVPPRDQSPLIGWPNGLGSLGPGGSAVLHTDLPAGEYLLFSYITNPETGLPRAYEGMHRLTRLV